MQSAHQAGCVLVVHAACSIQATAEQPDTRTPPPWGSRQMLKRDGRNGALPIKARLGRRRPGARLSYPPPVMSSC
jgi:hypothetical protein